MQHVVSVLVFLRDQIAFHMGNWARLWDLINIGLPVIVPFLGMLIVKRLKTSDARHNENAKIIATIKDGQLGYIAAVMDLSMTYELIGHVVTSAAFIALVLGIVCIVAGMVLAAHGAVYTTEMAGAPKGMGKKMAHYQLMWSSVGVTVVAALTFHHAHYYLLK